MYWKYLGKLTKSDYYIIERKDSMLIIRRGGTFLPTPGHVRVKVIPGWDIDIDIARDKSMFWHGIWKDCGKMPSGVV